MGGEELRTGVCGKRFTDGAEGHHHLAEPGPQGQSAWNPERPPSGAPLVCGGSAGTGPAVGHGGRGRVLLLRVPGTRRSINAAG